VLVPDHRVHELGQLQDLQQAVVLGQGQAGHPPDTIHEYIVTGIGISRSTL